MATLHPFRALRPKPTDAALIAAVPYDVVSSDEARALSDGNPLSFLRVSRAEIELPPGADPYSDAVYQRAARNFDSLKKSSLVVEDEPALYFYRLRRGDHEQTGIAGCFSIDEYEHGVIKKHERTRRDKEDDRTRHMLAVGAQTGPVFLTYRASADIDRIATRATEGKPLFDFEATDGVRHTIWRLDLVDGNRLVEAVRAVPTLYIADGHHRAASAARAHSERRDRRLPGTSLGDVADASTFLAVAFPDDEVQILPYNRIVRDFGGLSAEGFRRAVGERFEMEAGPAAPACRGQISMYVEGRWHTLRPRVGPDRADPIASLDVSVLQDQLLAPVLKITDVRTDKRIDFVGGARGTTEIERLVDSGKAVVAFSLYPVRVADLMAVSDADAIMPPKSTWFEPKLRDGLLIHLI
ncbi:MAG: hypothetical protein A3G76_15130 [Acidobacteria bacterium RIFCSPLOWO2_12_FULL_65_11]|nr:MAG: hypothetical protein A3G76_15130 [Acidobacteria bacterium RIFCSPLOWO2_12_FULL_65_11]